jgi:hypothetical protein
MLAFALNQAGPCLYQSPADTRVVGEWSPLFAQRLPGKPAQAEIPLKFLSNSSSRDRTFLLEMQYKLSYPKRIQRK